MSLQSIARWASILVVPTLLAFPSAASASNGTIQIEIYKAGFIVGGSGGKGTLKLGGKTYSLEIGGVSLGATIGVSKAELVGEVLNIKQAADVEGVFSGSWRHSQEAHHPRTIARSW